MRVKWRTVEDLRHDGLQHDKIDYFICSCCDERVLGTFLIIKDETPKVRYLLCELCPECLLALRATITPLSVLVQTGKDTKNESC